MWQHQMVSVPDFVHGRILAELSDTRYRTEDGTMSEDGCKQSGASALI